MLLRALVCCALLGLAVQAADLSKEIIYHLSNGRQYAISNPQDSHSGIPLILYYHGINTPCTKVTGDIIDAASNQGFSALIGSVCGSNGQWDINGQSDITYTHNVIDDIASRYPIDRTKVFLTGWSMGGMMCSRIACQDGGIAAGIAMVDCAFNCDNFAVKTNLMGVEAIYDTVCVNWISPAYASWATAYGCSAGSGDTRRQTCSGKYLDLDRQPAGHNYIDVPNQVAFFKKIAGGSTPSTCTAPANPANGHFTCTDTACALICDNGYGATGTGHASCVNSAWTTLPVCVSSGTGTQACGLVSEGQAMALSCPNGSVINTVEFASYGQPQGSCTNAGVSTACDAATSLSVVEAACVGKASCSVTAENAAFTDPCYGTSKQLAVRAHCAAASGVCTSGSEWATVTLSCPSGQNIAGIVFASYGTSTGSCSSGFVKSSCHATTSLDVVQKTCVGKNSCSFTGGQMNTAFGDPCSGTGKTLAIQALCA